ncbi:MAG: class C sortase [Lachnospiraceae bacterium]|nr:class C sortase [Lachnospiraceae bacterium]
MRFFRKHFTTILLLLILLAGVSLLLYPTISDYWNSFHQSRAIATYVDAVAELDENDYEEMWQAAAAYNETLLDNSDRWNLTEEEEEEYNSILDVTGTGIMGYIEIPKISVYLPIYHGTDEGVLEVAIGHLSGSSLPVGGEGTHCVVSGHRGLPSAKLFTDLDELEEGDIFVMYVLDQTLTYEVDQILIVEPDDLTSLEIEEGEDLCTLVTCTPYGVNSHRMLVRGHRVENQEDYTVSVTSDAQLIDEKLVAPFVAAPMILLFLLWVMCSGGKSKKRKEH